MHLKNIPSRYYDRIVMELFCSICILLAAESALIGLRDLLFMALDWLIEFEGSGFTVVVEAGIAVKCLIFFFLKNRSV